MTELFDQVVQAISRGDFKEFYQLTKDEEDIFQLKNEYGSTLLHLVAANVNAQSEGYEYDYIPFIKYLLEQGVEVNATNDKGQTPLDLSVGFGCSSAATYLLKNGAKAGNMNINLLSHLLFGVVYDLIEHPQDHKYTQHEKAKLLYGACDAYNKCHKNMPQEPATLEILIQNKMAQGNVKKYKYKIDNYIDKFEIISHCSTEASLSLLHASRFEGADKGIASHLADFIADQDMFSIFSVNKSTYAPLKAYLNPVNSGDPLEDLAAAGGSSAPTDEFPS